jgi:IclR family transcriptional regulator, blcABC operon repressor
MTVQNPSLERAVRLLDRLAQPQAHATTLAQLTRELALPKSSVHGLLHSLVALDLARKEPDGRFALGPRALHWASAYGQQYSLVQQFKACLERQPLLHAETIMLAVLNQTPATSPVKVNARGKITTPAHEPAAQTVQVMYLACRAGTRPLAVTFREGGQFPAYCTSSGKAILATYPDEQIKQLLGAGPFKKLTDKTLGSPKAVMQNIETIRTQGFAVDDEETAIGMHCFGAPVFNAEHNHACAAVAVSLIKASTSDKQRKQIISAICGLAHDLTKHLGGTALVPGALLINPPHTKDAMNGPRKTTRN